MLITDQYQCYFSCVWFSPLPSSPPLCCRTIHYVYWCENWQLSACNWPIVAFFISIHSPGMKEEQCSNKINWTFGLFKKSLQLFPCQNKNMITKWLFHEAVPSNHYVTVLSIFFKSQAVAWLYADAQWRIPNWRADRSKFQLINTENLFSEGAISTTSSRKTSSAWCNAFFSPWHCSFLDVRTGTFFTRSYRLVNTSLDML